MPAYEDIGNVVVELSADGTAVFSSVNYGNVLEELDSSGQESYVEGITGDVEEFHVTFGYDIILSTVVIGNVVTVEDCSGIIGGSEGSEIYPNSEWFLDNSLEGEFLWGRLQWQKNPHACRDSGPAVFGTVVDDDLSPVLYTLRYDKNTGAVSLNNVTQFTAPTGCKKLDFSFDVWGYPLFVYCRSDNSAVIRYRDNGSGDYVDLELGEDITNIFVCGCERRVPGNSTYNKIYVLYERSGKILARQSQVENYGVEVNTDVEIPEHLIGKIEGFGVTTEFRIQARIKVRRQYG